MAIVLINTSVKKYLLNLPVNLRERIREKFEFLETGIWEGKLRAKKLRNISSKCVFESPIDKDNSLLFTLGKCGGTGGENLVIHVWEVASHHELSTKTRKKESIAKPEISTWKKKCIRKLSTVSGNVVNTANLLRSTFTI
ncbi:MAG: hypothetical protein ACLFVG_04945 [Candidatus Aminicenantes bacterium]